MSKATAWESTEVRGPKLAFSLTPENCGRMLKRAKRLLIVVGGGALDMKSDGIDVPDFTVTLAKTLNGTIAISPGVYKAYQKYSNVKIINIGLEDLVNRLKESDWNGFDDGGAYDMVVFIGGLYYFQSMMLSTLKHFAPKVKTISIDRFYHPNAEFSLENLSIEKWREGLDSIIKILKVK